MPKRRLPTYLPFPGGFMVKVHQVKSKSLDPKDAADFVWHAGGAGGTIRIPKKAARQEKLDLLMHEIEHACAEWRLYYRRLLE